MAIEPYRHLLGIESTRTVARLCGVSAYSVDQYRKSLGVKAKPGPPSLPKPKRFPVNHPLRRYKPLLGIVHDQDVADLAGVSRTTVRNWREALGRAPADPLPKQPTTAKLKNYVGPWLGYESLFGSMSAAKISRAVGVPYPVVEQRQKFLGVTTYKRVSKLARYQHLIGLIPIGLLAELAGVSISRASEFRNKVLAEQN
jgi:transcriptional regulator with XRE-family HTH domain